MTDAEGGGKKKTPFRALQVRAKPKPGRGNTSDPNVVCDALYEAWDELRTAIEALPETERDALKSHFNDLIEDEDDLGDHLFGDMEDAEARFK